MPLTSLGFLDKGQDWPPKSERDRLDTYNANRKLYESDHRDVFKDWPRLLREDSNATLEFVLNWPKRLSTLWADLVAGDPPTFSVAEKHSPEQEYLDGLILRNQLPPLLYDLVIDQSRYGDALFKLRLEDGQAIIEGQCPAYWFPVVSICNVRDIKYHVLAWPFTGRYKGEDRDLLKVEVHDKGKITHRVLVVGKNKKIEAELDPRVYFPELISDEEATGVDDFLVQQAPGSSQRPLDRLFGLDDYKSIESIIQEMECRLGQISRILDKHADPNMYGPEWAMQVDRRTGQPFFRGGGKYFPITDEDNPPGYMVWEGQLAAAFQELEELKVQFYVTSETSPSAFGQLDVGVATSGTALRRLMQAPLAKARGMRNSLDWTTKKVIRLAAELEGEMRGVSDPRRGIDQLIFPGLTIGWKDGLPDDPQERASIEETKINSGLTSKYSAIKRLLDGDDEATQQEMERIKEEEGQQAMLNGSPSSALQGTPDGQFQESAQLLAQKLKQQGGANGSSGSNSSSQGSY